METLGSLIDKLTIANTRLWHLEDERRNRSLPDKDRLAACDKVSIVNRQRNDLIDEINQLFSDAISGKVTKLIEPKHKDYTE